MIDQEEAAAIEAYYTAKDENARKILIEKNVRIVEAVIKNRFKVKEQDIDDVLMDGILILEKAIDEFFLENSQRFHIYLYRKIYNGLKNIYPEYNVFEPNKARKEEEIVVEESDQGCWESEEIDELYLQQAADAIKDIISNMPIRDREIIEYRFGLKDGEQKTYKEIAKKFNISRERVREISEKVLHKLRKELLCHANHISCGDL